MKRHTVVHIPIGAHPLAFAQARALASIARNCESLLTTDPQGHGDILAYLVNIGLSIELYFKAIMIVARHGRVTKGHALALLYAEFPDFL